MKKQKWRIILAAILLAAVLVLCAGIAAAEETGARTYTDSQGRKFRVVPLGDGRYELWMLTGVKSDEELSAEMECQHLNAYWEKGNDSFHWQYCPDCKKTFEPLAHEYNLVTVTKAATCKTNAELQRSCVCGRVDTKDTSPKQGENAEWFAHHTWGSEYETDEWGHRQTCTVCGEKDIEHPHVISNLTVDREPTCILYGSVSFDCSVCGYHVSGLDVTDSNAEKYPELAKYKPLGHDYTGPLKTAKGSEKQETREGGAHGHTCTRCGRVDRNNTEPHAWQEYTISNGTCEDPNDPVIIGGTCECGATLELSYERHHKYVKDSSKDVQPTCTESGKLNGERCIYCGVFGNYDFAEPIGHEWYEETERRKEPTCEEKGASYWYCWRCDAEETREIPTKSTKGHHEFVRKDVMEASCNGNGWYDMVCKICGEDDKQGPYFIESLPHDSYSKTKKSGREMSDTTRDGVPMVGQVMVTEIWCRRCHQKLGEEERTVWKSTRGNRYKIYPGRHTSAPENTKDCEVVKGQMAKDGGVFFEGEVEKALAEEIKKNLPSYDHVETGK